MKRGRDIVIYVNPIFAKECLVTNYRKNAIADALVPTVISSGKTPNALVMSPINATTMTFKNSRSSYVFPTTQTILIGNKLMTLSIRTLEIGLPLTYALTYNGFICWVITVDGLANMTSSSSPIPTV